MKIESGRVVAECKEKYERQRVIDLENTKKANEKLLLEKYAHEKAKMEEHYLAVIEQREREQERLIREGHERQVVRLKQEIENLKKRKNPEPPMRFSDMMRNVAQYFFQ